MPLARNDNIPGNEIHAWRPRIWADFLGKKNRAVVTRLQKVAVQHYEAAARGQPLPLAVLPPSLLVGPYGVGKTMLAEHLIQACCCPHITPEGDPCHACEECVQRGYEFNNLGARYLHFHVRCEQLFERRAVAELLAVVESQDEVAILWDELGKMTPRLLNMLLGMTTNFCGVFLATATTEDFGQLPPPVFDRLRPLWVYELDAEEMTAFFCNKSSEWRIAASPNSVRTMVEATGRSFRKCLQIMQAASVNKPPALDLATIDEFVPCQQLLQDHEDIHDD